MDEPMLPFPPKWRTSEERAAAAVELVKDSRIETGQFALADVEGFYVYRLYDAQGELLYVGQSTTLYHRLYHHRRTSVFGEQIHFVKWERFDNRRAMDQQEALLIRSLHPPFNTVGVGAAPRYVA